MSTEMSWKPFIFIINTWRSIVIFGSLTTRQLYNQTKIDLLNIRVIKWLCEKHQFKQCSQNIKLSQMISNNVKHSRSSDGSCAVQSQAQSQKIYYTILININDNDIDKHCMIYVYNIESHINIPHSTAIPIYMGPNFVIIHYSDIIMSTMASQTTSLAIVYLIVCSGADQRKHQSSTSLAFVRGIHRGPVNSPHKGPVTHKMFPFDDVIMCTCRCPGRLAPNGGHHRAQYWLQSWSVFLPSFSWFQWFHITCGKQITIDVFSLFQIYTADNNQFTYSLHTNSRWQSISGKLNFY